MFSSSDRGTRRGVPVGVPVEIALPENPTTGYQWVLETPSTDLRVVTDEFAAPAGAAMGAPGTRRLSLVPQHPGSIDVRLVKRRPWESPSTLPKDEYVLHLDVQPQDEH